MDGFIGSWNYETNQWNRYSENETFVLKGLNNSKDITLEFLKEVIF